MYVIMYMRLISRRTSQRVLVGRAVAAFPGRMAEPEGKMRFVSGMRSGTVCDSALYRIGLFRRGPLCGNWGGKNLDRTSLFRRLVRRLIDLHNHSCVLCCHQGLLASRDALKKMNSFRFH